MSFNTEEIMRDIQDKVSHALEPFLHTRNTEQTRRDILSTLMDTMSRILQERGGATINDIDVDVAIDRDDRTMMNIVPKNFFTFLLLYGIYYPKVAWDPAITEYYVTEGPYIGTTFRWDPEKKQGYMEPPDMIRALPKN